MALALFDSLAEFLGILQIGIVILLAKEVFSLFGAFGGAGGGLFSPKNPFGAGRAEEVKEEQGLRKAEEEAKIAEKNEVKEQQETTAMAAALTRIDQFKNYERSQLDWLRRYIDDAIKVLEKYKGRLDAAAYQQLSALMGRIMPSPAQLKAETDQMRTLVNYLEKAEVVEAKQALGVLTRVYNDMRNKINKAAAKTPAAQAKKKALLTNLLKVRNNVAKDMQDIKTQLVKQMRVTKSKLEPTVLAMEKIEQELSTAITQVVEEIRLGNTKQAISLLKTARGLVDKLKSLIMQMDKEEKVIKSEIARRFKDLNDQKRLMQTMDLELKALTATP